MFPSALNPPSIPVSGQDKEDLSFANGLLQEMAQHTRHFEAAMLLYGHSISIKCHGALSVLAPELSLVPARDGAMSIWHFSHAFDGARTTLFKCASTKDLVDRSLSKAAGDAFKKAFPDFEKIRHAVAHTAELSKSLKSIQENSSKGGEVAPGLVFDGDVEILLKPVILPNDRFTIMIDGKSHSYVVRKSTAEELSVVTTMFFDAVRPVAAALAATGSQSSPK